MQNILIRNLNNLLSFLLLNQSAVLNKITNFAAGENAIQRVEPEITIESIEVNDQTATVKVGVITDIYWGAANPIGEPVLAKPAEYHTLKLSKDSGEWKIIEDYFALEPNFYLSFFGKTKDWIEKDVATLKDNVAKMKQKYNQEVEKAKKSTPSEVKIKRLNDKSAKSESFGLWVQDSMTDWKQLPMQEFMRLAQIRPLISQHSDYAIDYPWQKGAYKTYFMFITYVN